MQLECARGLHNGLLVPVLSYGSETLIYRLKEDLCKSFGLEGKSGNESGRLSMGDSGRCGVEVVIENCFLRVL